VLGQLERCALDYGCRAAQNFFIGRHEAPLPTSVTCNSQCLGCISLQTDGEFKASHERLNKAPTPAEVAAVALEHIERVPEAVVSFGQGCEGEPLLNGDLLVESVRLIRAETSAGTINLNTNASKPEVVERLAAAGLDSIRVSLNSPRPEVYDAYYRPHGYGFDDVLAAMAAMKRHRRFVSINYLVFPGVTDTEEEYAAIDRFVDETDLDLVQMRNLNIDPELYVSALPPGTVSPGFGIRRVMERLRTRYAHLQFGYFNPPKERFSLFRARAGAS
jgi:MoaA/NifB/PqqE/SkfB family radical SAM enzyme